MTQTPDCASRLGFIDISSTDDSRKFSFSHQLYRLFSHTTLDEVDPAGLKHLIPFDKRSDEAPKANETCIKIEPRQQMFFDDGRPDLHSIMYSNQTEENRQDAAEFWIVGKHVAEKLDLRTSEPHLLINGRVRYSPFCGIILNNSSSGR